MPISKLIDYLSLDDDGEQTTRVDEREFDVEAEHAHRVHHANGVSHLQARDRVQRSHHNVVATLYIKKRG